MNIVLLFIISLAVLIAYQIIMNYLKMKKVSHVADHADIKQLTDANFKHQIKSGTTLVDFWADWCMPCKLMAPVLNQLADEAGTDVTVAKLNVEQNKRTTAEFKVRSIPTLILFRDGKESERFVGIKSKEFLRQHIEKLN
jgi:thioredoxin 1